MIYTRHADEQRIARGISTAEVAETIRNPERARPSRDGCYVFTRHVGPRRVKVVFGFGASDIVVVTVGDTPPRPNESPIIDVPADVITRAQSAR